MWVQNKVDESKHEIHSQVDAITAGTASVVNLTAGKFKGTTAAGVSFLVSLISPVCFSSRILLKSDGSSFLMAPFCWDADNYWWCET